LWGSSASASLPFWLLRRLWATSQRRSMGRRWR
jgi:hypothetical protein